MVGYLTDWGSFNLINTLNYSALTHINYAFAIPAVDGTIAISNDSWLSSVVTKAHAKNVRVNISVGGWGASDAFNPICSDPNLKSLFIDTLLNFVKAFNLDGIDIDWEFPSANESNMYEQFIYDLRLQMYSLEVVMSKPLELTAAVAMGFSNSQGISNTAVSYMDYINIMAYDADHSNGGDHSSVGVADAALTFWNNTRGINGSYLVLGVPFYTYGAYNQVSYKSFSSSDPAACYGSTDGVFYNTNTLFTYKVNSKPILETKADMVDNIDGAGMMIWELAQDRTDQYSLLTVISKKMGTYVGVDEINENQMISAYPNPFKESFSINLSTLKISNPTVKFTLSDITGKQILESNHNSQGIISIQENLNTGVYIGNISTHESNYTFKIVKQ